MISTTVTLALLGPAYTSTLICEEKDGFLESVVRCTVLTDARTIAGYTADSRGHHGETDLNKPFVWSSGKLQNLPLLPKSEYGAVLGGKDDLLVGWSAVQGADFPVTWRPDPKKGWAAAKITKLPLEGRATILGADGSIYIQRGNQLVAKFSNYQVTSLNLEDFALRAVDATGNLYGYKYKGWGYKEPANVEPGYFSKTTWRGLPTSVDSPQAYIWDVNASGVAVGEHDNRFAIWRDGKLIQPDIGKSTYSHGQAINAAGDVVGSGELLPAFLWSKGQVTDISDVIAGRKLDSAQRINGKGDIVATVRTEKSTRLFLLQPK